MNILTPGLESVGCTVGTRALMVLDRMVPAMLGAFETEALSSPLSLLRMLAPELKRAFGLMATFHMSDPMPASASNALFVEATTEAAFRAGKRHMW